MTERKKYIESTDDPCENYHKGADTSRKAWQSLKNGTASQLARAVFETIRTSVTGLTCEEVEDRAKLSHQTASARITELKAKGLISWSGLFRKTTSGRLARVYVVCDKHQVSLL